MTAVTTGGLRPGVLVGGKYAVERKVGEGAFAEVWLGRDLRTEERVALKRLRGNLASDEEIVARFQREAFFLSRVQSDHVAKINELVVDPVFQMVLVMEFVEGHLLSQLTQRTLLGVEEAVDLGIDLLCGLRDLHAARIIHRDLKPSNVILKPIPEGFRAVIFDFSLSRLANRARPRAPGERSMTPSMNAITRANMALGTLEYMAPEQILDAREVDERSDIYALGAMLYGAVAGEHPFAELEDLRDLARGKLQTEAPPLMTGRTDLLAIEFEGALAKALSRRPADRYPSATSMLEEFKRFRTLAGDWEEPDGPHSVRLVARGSTGTARRTRRSSRSAMPATHLPSSDGANTAPYGGGPYSAPSLDALSGPNSDDPGSAPDATYAQLGEDMDLSRDRPTMAPERARAKRAWVLAVLGVIVVATAVGVLYVRSRGAPAGPVAPMPSAVKH